MKHFLIFSLLVPTFVALACSPFIASRQFEPVPEEPQVVVIETMVVPPTPDPSPIPELFFPKATYQDTTNNFEFDYPANWAFNDGEQHSRGYYVQFYSWSWQPGDPTDPTPVGGTQIQVLVLYWDPKNDLEAFINKEKSRWDSSGPSGKTILSEEHITLTGDRPAVQYTVQNSNGTLDFYMFTTVGEQYLTISGSGDLGLLADIAHTLRFSNRINFKKVRA